MTDEDILPAALAWRIAGHKDAEAVPADFAQVYVPAAVSRVVELCGPAEGIAERAGIAGEEGGAIVNLRDAAAERRVMLHLA